MFVYGYSFELWGGEDTRGGRLGGVYISCLELSCNYLERHGDRALGSRKLLGHVTVDTHCYGCYVYTTIITIQPGVYSNTA